MPIFDTFFKRQKRLRGEVPDVFTYEELPYPLRVQIVQIMKTQVGDSYGSGPAVRNAYNQTVETLRRELGVFQLPHSKQLHNPSTRQEISNYILKEPDVEYVLSAVEIVCWIIEKLTSKCDYRNEDEAEKKAQAAIDEINARFKEHGIGFEYDGEIIRIDNELVHAEAVKPALSLLRGAEFKGAEDEFLKAYEHYRKGAQKEALNEALKAFESTMKSIYEKKGWTYNANDTASRLVQVGLDNDLIPSFWQKHFSGLRSTLEASVPTVRNRLSGHGQGTLQTKIPDHIVGYTLHQTASIIVFLVRAYEAGEQGN